MVSSWKRSLLLTIVILEARPVLTSSVSRFPLSYKDTGVVGVGGGTLRTVS